MYEIKESKLDFLILFSEQVKLGVEKRKKLHKAKFASKALSESQEAINHATKTSSLKALSVALDKAVKEVNEFRKIN